MSEAGRGNPSPTVRLPYLNTPSVRPGRDGGRNGERKKTSKGTEWRRKFRRVVGGKEKGAGEKNRERNEGKDEWIWNKRA